MSNADPATVSGQPKDIVRRPKGQLHDFSVEVRWAVTRRHPYYLALWEDARRYRQSAGDPPARRLLGHVATLVLAGIGVTGEPVSPTTPAADIMGGDPAFLTGSVQPLTLRHMIDTLLVGLPAAEREFVGELFQRSGRAEQSGGPGEGPSRRTDERLELARFPSAALDSCPDAPLFYVHLGASRRSIARDMEDQAKAWQDRKGITPGRIHSAKLSEYLEVWDLREGWTGAGYDRAAESAFAAIADRLDRPLSTVATQYRAAFKMIVGHEFGITLWWEVFGPLRLAPSASGRIFTAATRRLLASPARRPVPEADLTRQPADLRTSGLVDRKSAIKEDRDLTDALIDLPGLFAQGLSDRQIADKLGFQEVDLVAEVRGRVDEFRPAFS